MAHSNLINNKSLTNVILSVGTVSLDTIETNSGKVFDSLGGSVIFFSVAASFYNSVSLVGVAGQDFPQNYIHYLQSWLIDLEGLTIANGKTFRWIGKNVGDVFETIEIRKNTLYKFIPVLSEKHRKLPIVFLGNTDPEIQFAVASQVKNNKLLIFDTCNYYINNNRDLVTTMASNADIILLNQNELQNYSRKNDINAGAELILNSKKVKFLIVKNGNNGSKIYTNRGEILNIPAFPVNQVIDDTGAGDCFAGGFVGYLSTIKEITCDEIKRGALHGSVMGSFAVEDFSVNKFQQITHDDIYIRYNQLLLNI